MKFLVVLSVALACVAADVSQDSLAPVLRSDFDLDPIGNYAYAYETGNGISAQAKGDLKNQGSEYPSLEVQGGYKYTAPDGSPVEVNYVAGENGYIATGNVIPTSHPIPEYILRSLDYIATHQQQQEPKTFKPYQG